MEVLKSKIKILLWIVAIALIILIIILPMDILEYLSLEVVGEPPINGLTWLEGVDALGGSISMRFLAIMGVSIIIFVVPNILKLNNKNKSERVVKKTEIILFISITILFFIINLLIGYDWWDPDAFLGMGPLFFPSILSLVFIAIAPDIIKKIYGLKSADFAQSTKNIKKISVYMILIGYGYGLVSLIWHCCSFFDAKMYFFFFVIKLIQLWGMCSFFYRWGLPLFRNILKDWQAFLVISILFGFCYPWHTIGFAIVFIFFGLLICYLTKKTNSFIPGLILLYFAYIFHAGLAWHGSLITFSVIYPITIIIFIMMILVNIWKFKKE